MDFFDVLALIGGLALFLFGMNIMGDALEKKAGGSMRKVLGKMTDSKVKGFGLGLGVTSVIQSSSATTVMVVGFVNSGIMTLRQAINIIMGANVGTTVTAWILSLTGIEGSNFFVQILKPSSFTPILAIIGIALIMLSKKPKRKDTGMILMGFATLMFGMDAMSGAVAGLKDVPEFAGILTMFENPILGVLAGAVLTAIIQSSSASVGILQALSSTGAVSIGATIPIIMGQNIGTTVTAMLSSVGTNKNARRAALVHLYFNIIGTVVLLTVYCILNALIDFAFVDAAANEMSIAVVHSCFNILCTAMLFPFAGMLEKLAYRTIKDDKVADEYQMLDKLLIKTPAIALDRASKVACVMADITKEALFTSFDMLTEYDENKAQSIRADEDKVDKYEDKLGDYLVTLSRESLTVKDSNHAAKLLRLIGDVERISDHSVNILESAEEMHEKKISFSPAAKNEVKVMTGAVKEIVYYALRSYSERDAEAVMYVEAIEQVIDELRDEIKNNHIARLQKGECTIELGFVLQDVLTNLERVADHCTNIAGYVRELMANDMQSHKLQEETRKTEEFASLYKKTKELYSL